MTSIANNTIGNQPVLAYDRKKDVKDFEDTKLGVKGLVDSGITRIPPIFQHPEENLIKSGESEPDTEWSIPVIDLSGPTQEVVGQVKDAANKFGFFQVVNHGVTVSLLDRLVSAVKAFHELPAEERMKHYTRDMGTGVNYFSNVDLFLSKAASWRDTLQLRLGPTMAQVDAIPAICREEIIEWEKEVKKLDERLLELFSLGLGVDGNKLKDMSCAEGRVMVGHYYPHCPEPEKTVGIASHTDPGILTVLLQDQVGGLQVKYQGKWVNVEPIHGALVINVGDLLQVINHGVPVALLDRLLDAIKAFHELSPEEKTPHYRRDTTTCSSGGVGFYSNFDLFQSDAASWRDTLEIRLQQYDPEFLPDVCREEVIEWDKEVKQLAERLMALLSEGLGLGINRLQEMSCIRRRLMVGQYYPYCPEPNKTVGITAHTDLETLTILLQDQKGGLQVNCHGKWVDVKPVHGALVISIGDTLQMISNDEYKSGEHCVFAHQLREPRVSVAVFFDAGISEDVLGPLPELVSPEKPALYKQFKFSDVLKKGLDTGLEGEGKYTINYFRL